MKSKTLTYLIRWTLTIALLVFVWQNAHWSVAILLTFNALSWESVSLALDKLRGMNII